MCARTVIFCALIKLIFPEAIGGIVNAEDGGASLFRFRFGGALSLVFALVAAASLALSHLTFRSAPARLAATFVGTAAALTLIAARDLFQASDVVARICADNATGARLSPGCALQQVELMQVFDLALLAWAINIVMPVSAAAVVAHAWLLFAINVVAGLRRRIRS